VTVFDEIYETNAWRGVESRSGPGSGPIATRHLARVLPPLCSILGVKSVLDVGCGDGYWMPDLPGYLGVDVAWPAIEAASKRNPGRRYRCIDIRRVPVGHFDLVFTRDAMQHLSLSEGVELLRAITEAVRPTWLMASTYQGGENVDIETGDAYSPDLTAEPFNLGKPEQLMPDGYAYHEGGGIRDARKMMGLWRLDGG